MQEKSFGPNRPVWDSEITRAVFPFSSTKKSIAVFFGRFGHEADSEAEAEHAHEADSEAEAKAEAETEAEARSQAEADTDAEHEADHQH